MSYKLAISNIAWPFEAEERVLELLDRHGVRDIEVAPSKIWPRPAEAVLESVRRYKEALLQRGFRIVSAQALLFGRPDLTVFESVEQRERTLTYLDAVVAICAELGAEALVFGAPKNRRRGSMGLEAAWDVGVTFFDRVAAIAERHGTVVVVEANPPQYGTDFLTRASEAAELVRRVNRPGLRLILDTACMNMAGDNIEGVIGDHSKLLHHFHISAPNLAPVDDATLEHHRIAEVLRSAGYARWVSIEMRTTEPFGLSDIDRAIAWAKRVYLDDR